MLVQKHRAEMVFLLVMACKRGEFHTHTYTHTYTYRGYLVMSRVSLVAQRVNNPPAMRETRVRSLGQEDSPGEGNGNPLQ